MQPPTDLPDDPKTRILTKYAALIDAVQERYKADPAQSLKYTKRYQDAAEKEILSLVAGSGAAPANVSAFDSNPWMQELHKKRSKEGIAIEDNDANLGILFAKSPEFKGALEYNELSHDIIFNRTIKLRVPSGVRSLGTPLPNSGDGDRYRATEDDLPIMQQWLRGHLKFPKTAVDSLERHMKTDALVRKFHPVRKYLADCYREHGATMTQAEAEELVYGALERHFGAQDLLVRDDLPRHFPEITRAKSRVLFLSAVARAMPGKLTKEDGYGIAYKRSDAGMLTRSFGAGCLVKQMVVLQGRSNLRKSAVIHAMSPSPEYVSEEQLDFAETKDSAEIMMGKWLGEYPEFDQALYGRASAAQCKAFVSKRKDRFRPPYARQAREFERQFILIGTMNPLRVLNDDTTQDEVSRYLVVRCGVGWPNTRAIDAEAFAQIRDKVWGAAVKLYAFPDEGHAPAIWWIDRGTDPEVANLLIEGQKEFEEENPALYRLSEWLACPTYTAKPWKDDDCIPTDVLMENAFAGMKDKPTKRNIDNALKTLGWESRAKTASSKHRECGVASESFRAWHRPASSAVIRRESSETSVPF